MIFVSFKEEFSLTSIRMLALSISLKIVKHFFKTISIWTLSAKYIWKYLDVESILIDDLLESLRDKIIVLVEAVKLFKDLLELFGDNFCCLIWLRKGSTPD